jgi:hypothetical protein
MTVALFVGCGKPLAPADLTGTWMPQAASRKWLKGTNICQITLQSNGVFTASVPDRMLGTPDQAFGKIVPGRGHWFLEADGVRLNFDEVDGRPSTWSCQPLKMQGGKDNIQLFFYVEEDGGKRFVFERMAAQAASQDAGK